MLGVETKPTVGSGSGVTRLRHIVETDAAGRPVSDHCLCGYIWDAFPMKHDPDSGICEKCVEILKQREGLA